MKQPRLVIADIINNPCKLHTEIKLSYSLFKTLSLKVCLHFAKYGLLIKGPCPFIGTTETSVFIKREYIKVKLKPKEFSTEGRQ